MDLLAFQEELTAALHDELCAWQPRLAKEEMRAFDLGCFPWFESLELSFLTQREDTAVTANPGQEIAAWRLYGFSGRNDGSWTRARALLSWLEERRRADDKTYSNEQIWRACAVAAGSEKVAGALSLYARAPEFLVTVFNPDDPKLFNYCTDGAPHWLAPETSP